MSRVPFFKINYIIRKFKIQSNFNIQFEYRTSNKKNSLLYKRQSHELQS